MRDNDLKSKTLEELEALEAAANQHLLLNQARESVIELAKHTMPDPNFPDDITKTLYLSVAHHVLMGQALEKLERKEIMRLAISMPPQHGKTKLASIVFICWYAGRHPERNIMFGTYNEKYAKKIGGQVRDILTSARYKSIFPAYELKKGSKAKDSLESMQGGQINFIGRGGSGTGLPADLVVIDDPIKNAAEANSPAVIDSLHDWYYKVIRTRVRTMTAILLIHTRWLEDDLIGRACDPDHPDRKRDRNGRILRSDSSREWDYINIPAVLTPGKLATAMGIKLVTQTDMLVVKEFGDQPMRALWPENFSLRHLAQARRDDKITFAALYMGTPTPDDGEYFTAADLVEYEKRDLPENLRIYAASDHALTERKDRDYTVLGCVGVDENDNIWVLPDLIMRRMTTDKTVDEMLAMMRTRKPMVWWAENDTILKSIGPFLRKRMHEEKVYTLIQTKPLTSDKRARARSIQGRMQMGKVRFPRYASWWLDARKQLLKFPRATHDDFVDWLAWIGLGLSQELAATAMREDVDTGPKIGTIGWIKKAAADRRASVESAKLAGGF